MEGSQKRAPVWKGGREQRAPVWKGEREQRAPVWKGEREQRAPVWEGEREMVNGSRVVVTGTGAMTSLGHATRETWEAVKAGRSGVRRVQACDPSGMPGQV